ncbi:MAG: transposase [Acidobacteriia bacterium]|nr:transposase [Terriglobia bacterium]
MIAGIPKPLVILTADQNAQFAIQALIRRPADLGIRPIEFDCYPHPGHDSGVYKRAHEFLRAFLKWDHALVVFDREGCGHDSFLYQAASWKTARRVVAKVEFHFGELFPRVGFIVTSLETESRAVVRFYNKRGTAEQWIKEGKQAVKMTRLSGHRFRSNEVRLWLSVMAYNLGNLWRRLVLPKTIDYWSLTRGKGGSRGKIVTCRIKRMAAGCILNRSGEPKWKSQF